MAPYAQRDKPRGQPRGGESGRNDFVAGMLADVSEVVLPPRVMNCEALRPPAIF